MELTKQQHALIARYLDEVCARHDDHLPETARARMRERLERRLLYDLEALGNDTVSDKDIVAVIRQHARAGQSTEAEGQSPPSAPSPQKEDSVAEDRIWLGVCARLADRLGMPVWSVRVLAVMLGFLGPFVLVVYLALYVELYYSMEPAERPIIKKWRIAFGVTATVLASVGIHLVAVYSTQGIYLAYEKLFQRSVPALHEWGWLELNRGSFLFWVLMCGVPLIILSALPLANGWASTMKRMTQALIALYAMITSFGIACILVGLILDFVQEFGG